MTLPVSVAPVQATLAGLARTPGKAELIDGRVVSFMAMGYRPSRIASRIFRALDDFSEATGRGLAFNDNTGFAVPRLSSGRQSFSPDAAYYLGPLPRDEMDFLEGPPALAVEVRSKTDSGPAAELEMAAKRADYFEAGTAIVWDVDAESQVVRSYLAATPETPITFVAGQIAEAEPVVPGWRVAVDQIFA